MLNFYDYHSARLDEYSRYGVILNNVCDYLKTKQGNLLEPILHILKNDAWGAYVYAKHIVGGRWVEGEPTIKKSANYSFIYALEVIRDRWLEAEPVIFRDRYFWVAYKASFNVEDNDVYCI